MKHPKDQGLENRKTATEAVLTEEGGMWMPFEEFLELAGPRMVHAVRFKDGTIWDAYNGWR